LTLRGRCEGQIANASDGDDFECLLEAAQTSARELLAAGRAPQSAALRGWLVTQRLERVEVVHGPVEGADPERAESHYAQIWLTADGRLRHARLIHRRHHARSHDHGGGRIEVDAIQPGAEITSPQDIGPGWDDSYGPRSQRDGNLETILYDVPAGPLTSAADRIARALEYMIMEGRGGGRPPSPPKTLIGRIPLELGACAAAVVGLAGLFAVALVLWNTLVRLLGG